MKRTYITPVFCLIILDNLFIMWIALFLMLSIQQVFLHRDSYKNHVASLRYRAISGWVTNTQPRIVLKMLALCILDCYWRCSNVVYYISIVRSIKGFGWTLYVISTFTSYKCLASLNIYHESFVVILGCN